MRIERINCLNLIELGNIQWTFPVGSSMLKIDRGFQTILYELINALFYNLKTPRRWALSKEGSIEAWITNDNIHYYIRRDFLSQEDGQECLSTLMIKDQDGRNVSLPDSMTLGEYLFQVKLHAFRQGGVIEWPKGNKCENFLQRISNLRQGGDENLSLESVRGSLSGAQKKVDNQKESMGLIKAEYDTLRSEWETVHRLLDEERLLQIEIKNLQEKEILIAEKINGSNKIQDRLALLAQNPDYRELRRLKGELSRLEERSHELGLKFKSMTCDSQVDMTLIDCLHEECMEWAFLQEQVEQIASEVKKRSWKIEQIQEFLLSTGYHGMSEGEYERLLRMEEERNKVQEELDKFATLKSNLVNLQTSYAIESSQLEDLAIMSGVTASDELKIIKREKYLKLWHNSKIASRIDGMIKKRLGGRSISKKLSSWLFDYYKTYQTTNNQEFMNKLNHYREQRMLIKKTLSELDLVRENVSAEKKLQQKVHQSNKLLQKAFAAVNVSDLSGWLQGWEDFQIKKQGLNIEFDELNQAQERLSLAEKTLAICAEQLRDKLENWGETTKERDEVLAAVLRVASQLRAKEEAEKEFAIFSQRFQNLLGTRNLENLAKILEPMAELERETCLSDQGRQEKLATWHKERMEINHRLATAKKRHIKNHKLPTLADLEKKIDLVKRQWSAHENLRNALIDAQVSLEAAWQEWQSKYSRSLNEEMQWIYKQLTDQSETLLQSDQLVAKRKYFSYRMAIAQLALSNNTDIPLFFLAGERNDDDEENGFWNDVLEYLHKISVPRQVIFCTTDPILLARCSEKGWQPCETE